MSKTMLITLMRGCRWPQGDEPHNQAQRLSNEATALADDLNTLAECLVWAPYYRHRLITASNRARRRALRRHLTNVRTPRPPRTVPPPWREPWGAVCLGYSGADLRRSREAEEVTG